MFITIFHMGERDNKQGMKWKVLAYNIWDLPNLLIIFAIEFDEWLKNIKYLASFVLDKNTPTPQKRNNS